MKNILIVDDSKTNILILQTMLEDAKYTSIHSCLSAKEAYKTLEKYDIDIILLDVGMPEIDGLEACKTIKNMPTCRHVPIIMVTADDSDENLQNSFDAGANDFVTKPVNFINLNSRMKNIFLLQEKDQLILNQTRSSAVSEIIEVLAHQWRQPLAAISSIAMNIQVTNELETLDNETLDTSMNNINDYCMELSKTINDIRDISKKEANAKSSNVNNLIQKAMNFIEQSYLTNKITIILSDKKLKDIKLFQNEFIKVLLNIFINSKEAFLRTQINEDTRKVEINTTQNDKNTIITIKDNAGGITQENLKKVFDPYFSTKNEKNGTGLGLYNSKQIIEEHFGAKIEIFSQENETTISIELPNDNPIF